MANEAMDPAIDALLSKDAIRTIHERYCRGVDRHDAALVEACFWPEAQAEYGIWKGRAAELPGFAAPLLREHYTNTNHAISQCHVELAGDRAVSETYCHASHHVADSANGVATDVVWCRYLDRLERRRGEWRIAERLLIVDQIMRVGAEGRGLLDFTAYTHGRQGPDDASCGFFKA
jgi:hypothetical protein